MCRHKPEVGPEGQEGRDELIRALVDYHVEIIFGLDYEVTVKETAHRAVRRFRV